MNTCGIFSQRLTDSIDTFGSNPIAGKRGQPWRKKMKIRNKSFLQNNSYLPSIVLMKKIKVVRQNSTEKLK